MKIFGGRKWFWQWDSNQKVIIDEDGMTTSDQVHYYDSASTTTPATTLNVAIRLEDDLLVADVPNILLQRAEDITAYLYNVETGNYRDTQKEYHFSVHTRDKPADYVYTQTEILEYQTFVNQVNTIKTQTEAYRDQAAASATAASTSATAAQTAQTAAETASTSATASATSASTSASSASTSATSASASAASAAAAQTASEAIEDNVEAIRVVVEGLKTQAQTSATNAASSANSAALSAGNANTSAVAAAASAATAQEAVGKTSYIGDNNDWYEWDSDEGEFVDTGVKAKGEGVPTGGSIGQILSKKTMTDYDTEWINPPATTDPDAVHYSADTKTTQEKAIARLNIDAEQSGAAATVQANLNTHTGNTAIHVTTADKATWNAKLDASQKGVASGVAELDTNGKVPSTQLPSYVDDVVEYASLSDFPETGESGKIYIALDTNKTYRWSGSTYVSIGSDLALGETESTAYRGDRGKTAYDHSQTTGNPHGTTLAQIDGDATHRTVTDDDKTAWNAKYDKPSGGIPDTDLSSAVNASLDLADSAYQKPASGIPKTDLASQVQASLGLADTAEQSANKVTAITAASTDAQYPSAKCVYDTIVASIALSTIAITKYPKMIYTTGDSFDPTGMEITATYANHTTQVVAGWTYSPSGALAEGTTTITVTYTEGGVTRTTSLTVTAATANVYGVCWDMASSSSELTRLTEDTDPNGYVNTNITTDPVPAVGTGSGSSPFDTLMPWSGMEEYNLIDGAVSYKQGEASFSRTQYDTVVKIPTFYYTVVNDGTNNKRYYYIADAATNGFELHPGSNKYVGRYKTTSGYTSKSGLAPQTDITRATSRTGHAARGNAFCQMDFQTRCAITLLYMVEFADLNGQTALAAGLTSGSKTNTGSTDIMTYHTGRLDGTAAAVSMQYRHIEDFWGNVAEWIDGINISDYIPYLCQIRGYYADDTVENYTTTGITMPASSSGSFIKATAYIDTMKWAILIPTIINGSESTYCCDKMWTNTGWQVLCCGGDFARGTAVGPLYFVASYASSTAGMGAGARLLFNP